MWFVVQVMKFGEGIARMTLGNSVVNSLGVAKAQELGKIDERAHITSVIYFEGSVGGENTEEDVEALGTRHAREKITRMKHGGRYHAVGSSWVT
jgi:hypothetical protein